MFTTIPVRRGFTEEVKALFELSQLHKSLVAGGYVRFMASSHDEPFPAEDFDIFVPDQTAFQNIAKELKRRGYQASKETIYYQNFTKNDITLVMLGRKPLNVQIIKPAVEGDNESVSLSVNFEEPAKLLERFDFTVVRVALLSGKDILADEDFKSDEESRTINIKFIRNPVHVLKRLVKYAVKGYTYDTKEVLKLFTYWNEYDEEIRKKAIETIAGNKKDKDYIVHKPISTGGFFDY